MMQTMVSSALFVKTIILRGLFRMKGNDVIILLAQIYITFMLCTYNLYIRISLSAH